MQIFPSGCRWKGAVKSGGNFSEQLHGLFGSYKCHPEPAGPTLSSVTAAGIKCIVTYNNA